MAGVRSLSFQDQVLTCGGGKGGISFLDLRTQRYLPLEPLVEADPFSASWTPQKIALRTGKGHVVSGVV